MESGHSCRNLRGSEKYCRMGGLETEVGLSSSADKVLSWEVFYYKGSCFQFEFLQWLAQETDHNGLQTPNLSLKVFQVVEYKIKVIQ